MPSGTYLHDPDPGYTGTPDPPDGQCARWVTITGYFYGWDGDSIERPLSFATAWILDVDWDGQPYPFRVVGADLLDYSGYLEFGPVCNQDGPTTEGAGTLDVVIVVVPASSAAKVVRYQAQSEVTPWTFQQLLYSAWTPHTANFDNIGDGSFFAGHWIVPSNTNGAHAFTSYSVWSGVLAGWDLVRNQVAPAYVPAQLEVHFLEPITPYGLGEPEDFPHYMVAGSACGWTRPDNPLDPTDSPNAADCPEHWDDFWWQVHIDSDVSARSAFVMNHLYAHFVTQDYWNGAYPSNGPTPEDSSMFAGDFDEKTDCLVPSSERPSYQLYCERRIDSNYDLYDSAHADGIAWAEGFADAFALRAMASRPGGSETSVFSFQRSAWDPDDPNDPWSYDFEFRPVDGEESIEEVTAGAVRDLDDAAADVWDIYAGGFDRVWQAFTYAEAASIGDFWDNWVNAFHAGDHVNEIELAQEAMYNNRLMPRASGMHSPYTGCTSVKLEWEWYTGSDFDRYEIHKSTASNFQPGAGTLVTTIYDPNTYQYLVTGLATGTTYYFELLLYNYEGWGAHSNRVNAATSSACGGSSPFVAPWNGTAFEVDNNILPLSEVFDREELDTEDHYRLHVPLVPKDGVYSLQLTEFEEEHSFLDSVDLWVVDHDPDAMIGVHHQTGEIRTFEEPEPAESAVDNYGRDVRRVLFAWDGYTYEGWHGDYVQLGFGRVREADARLVIVADPGHVHMKTRILVEVWNGTDWQWVDSLHHRKNFAYDVVDLSSVLPIGDLKIRLTGVSQFSLEQVGIDTSPQKPFAVNQPKLLSGTHSTSEDVTRQLLERDASYAEMTPGEQILLGFGVPERARGYGARSFILVSYGHYTHTHQPFQGTELSIDGRDVLLEAIIPEAPLGQYWDLEIQSLEWEMGDETSYAGRAVSHSYAAAGEYLVTVRITYADGHVKLYDRRILIS